jgi:hypothetical protein
VGEQIDCPTHVLKGGQNRCGSCTDVNVTKFGQCRMKQNEVKAAFAAAAAEAD